MIEILREEDLVAEWVLCLLDTSVRCKAEICALVPGVSLRLCARVEPASLCFEQVRTDLVGRHKLLVLVDDGTSETRLLDDDRCEHETRADLDQADIELGALSLLLGHQLVDIHIVAIDWLLLACLGLIDLVNANPDLAVRDRESHHVVYKWLGLARVLGNAEDLGEKLLDDAEMGLLVERCIKRKDWPRSLEAVTNKVKLLHCVQILEVHLHSGTIWWLAHPAVEILSFSCLKEEDVVAVVEFCIESVM